MKSELEGLLTEAMRQLEEASANYCNSDESRRTHWEAIGGAKFLVDRAIRLLAAEKPRKRRAA